MFPVTSCASFRKVFRSIFRPVLVRWLSGFYVVFCLLHRESVLRASISHWLSSWTRQHLLLIYVVTFFNRGCRLVHLRFLRNLTPQASHYSLGRSALYTDNHHGVLLWRQLRQRFPREDANTCWSKLGSRLSLYSGHHRWCFPPLVWWKIVKVPCLNGLGPRQLSLTFLLKHF